MTSSIQRALDGTLHAWAFAPSEHELGAAETAKAEQERVYSLGLYCARHHMVESFDLRHIEQLVHGLVGDLADTSTISPDDDGADDRTPDDILAEFCPTDQLRSYLDAECYLEHITGMIDSRLAS